MSDGDRKERVARYREASQQADDLALAGKRGEALGLLKKSMDAACKAGDEDYRLFFEAEVLGYSAADYPKQIELVGNALRWGREKGFGEDFFLARSCGAYHSLKGDEDGAIEWFERALAVNPNDYSAMRAKGISLANQGNHDAAIEWCDKALAVNPNDYKAMRARGVALSKKGNLDAGIEWFDKALAVNPHNYEAMRDRGVSLSKKGDLDAAIEWFDKALAVNPNDYDTMRNKGVSLANQGNHDAAISWFDKALSIRPDDVDIMRCKAIALGLKGLRDDAIRDLLHCLGRNPKDQEAAIWLEIFRGPSRETAAEVEKLVKQQLAHEQERIRAEQEARDQRVKLEAWRSLSARSAHRIGNELFCLQGGLRLLRGLQTPDCVEAVGDIEGCLERMRVIVREFQQFSVNPPPAFAPTAVGPLIREVVRRYAGIGQEIQIGAAVAADLPLCHLDRRQIEQVLGELLENALHCVNPGGKIEIEADAASDARGPRVHIVVKDTGPGIPAELKSRIFDPFFSQRPGGTGLGLAMVKQMVANHGGAIRETGKPGEGARFEIELPVGPRKENRS
jgi:signal transduction histidine kinase